MRHAMAIGLVLLLSGCVSERHFLVDSVAFGNPNAPQATSETADRALGHMPAVTPIAPQAGNVWPGPVQPMPTLSEVQKNANLPLGESYTPSLPSPYPPGQAPADTSGASVPVTGGALYSTQPGATAQPVTVPPDTVR